MLATLVGVGRDDSDSDPREPSAGDEGRPDPPDWGVSDTHPPDLGEWQPSDLLDHGANEPSERASQDPSAPSEPEPEGPRLDELFELVDLDPVDSADEDVPLDPADWTLPDEALGAGPSDPSERETQGSFDRPPEPDPGLVEPGPDTGPVPADLSDTAPVAVVAAGPPGRARQDVPWRPGDRPTTADRIFRAASTAAATTSLVIVATTLVFLLKEGWPAIASSGVIDFFTGSVWNPAVGRFEVGGLLLGTIIIASLALVVGTPLGVGMALFINEYAPARVRSVLTSVVDLLAALPSLIFGLWGYFLLQNSLAGPANWMGTHLSASPLFRFTHFPPETARSSFVAGMVVAIMILPIITSVSRDVMAQAPREQCEGALALGGTRWGMIRAVILPFGRSGIVGATLLGFGRALGETIAVAIILNLVFNVNWHVLETGGGSIAALIASRFGEAGPEEIEGLIAAGFALFVLTFAVNLAARWVVSRSARLA